MTEPKMIDGFDNYSVDTNGVVWSRALGSWRQIAIQPDKDGYSTVMLYRKGKRKNAKVHRLVLEAYVGPCPKGMEACHNNGISADCRLDNLRWDYPVNNHADKRKHGTLSRGESHHWAKIPACVAQEVKRRRSLGQTLREIAASLGVGESSVSRIARGLQCKG